MQHTADHSGTPFGPQIQLTEDPVETLRSGSNEYGVPGCGKVGLVDHFAATMVHTYLAILSDKTRCSCFQSPPSRIVML